MGISIMFLGGFICVYRKLNITNLKLDIGQAQVEYDVIHLVCDSHTDTRTGTIIQDGNVTPLGHPFHAKHQASNFVGWPTLLL